MSNKEKFEIRELECWLYDDEWTVNTSYSMGIMQTAGNVRKAFTNYLKRKHGITFNHARTIIDYDGDCYTILDRKTKEPLFMAIPNY